MKRARRAPPHTGAESQTYLNDTWMISTLLATWLDGDTVEHLQTMHTLCLLILHHDCEPVCAQCEKLADFLKGEERAAALQGRLSLCSKLHYRLCATRA